MTSKRILVIAGLGESLLNFRGPLLREMLARGCEVHVAAPGVEADADLHARLLALGVVPHELRLERAGRNPLHDLHSLWALFRLMRQLRPQAMLAYTVKPVVFGSMAARLARVPGRFALITGLGYAFQNTGQRRGIYLLVRTLYRLALSGASHVFFQNPDDRALFGQLGLVAAEAPSSVVAGSGVEVAHYRATAVPPGPMVFLMIARLLGDKGVREYAAAARLLRQRHPQVRCQLVGWIDENPDAIKPEELAAWQADGDIEYLGRLQDVRPAIEDCTVYVLPSYREGTPRTVLEAMSMGRAIITTDAPGCRETVRPGRNGMLVPVQSASALADAMERFVLEPGLASTMGQASRDFALERFDVRRVNADMLGAMGIA